MVIPHNHRSRMERRRKAQKLCRGGEAAMASKGYVDGKSVHAVGMGEAAMASKGCVDGKSVHAMEMGEAAMASKGVHAVGCEEITIASKGYSDGKSVQARVMANNRTTNALTKHAENGGWIASVCPKTKTAMAYAKELQDGIQ
jgi:hypothetical protein